MKKDTLREGIIVTVGPTMETETHFRKAIETGALNFRFHLAHRNRDHIGDLQRLKKTADDMKKEVCAIFDLPSSRPRTGMMADRRLAVGEILDIEFGDWTDGSAIPIPGFDRMLPCLSAGQVIGLADGNIKMKVTEIRHDRVSAIVTGLAETGCKIKSNMGLFFPGASVGYERYTGADRRLLTDCFKNGLKPDWLLLSFVSEPSDVSEVKNRVRSDFPDWAPGFMIKIETLTGLNHVNALAGAADALMAGRGDLLAEIEPERLYEAEQRIIRAGKLAGKRVVVATQLAEVFAETGNYSRPELIDMANAVVQGASALMLSKESCFCSREDGPVETIRLMSRIMKTYRGEGISIPFPPVLVAPRRKNYSIIAVEGPNGVGKSTLCRKLSEETGMKLFFGVAEQFLDHAFKKRMILEADWTASALYFISAAIELNRELSSGAEGKVCLTDRSPWSTLVQHAACHPEREKFLLDLMSEAAMKLPLPDHIIILEAGYHVCIERISEKGENERIFDKDSEAYFAGEQAFYRRIHDQHCSSAIIDTDGMDEQQVFEAALQEMSHFMAHKETGNPYSAGMP